MLTTGSMAHLALHPCQFWIQVRSSEATHIAKPGDMAEYTFRVIILVFCSKGCKCLCVFGRAPLVSLVCMAGYAFLRTSVIAA